MSPELMLDNVCDIPQHRLRAGTSPGTLCALMSPLPAIWIPAMTGSIKTGQEEAKNSIFISLRLCN